MSTKVEKPVWNRGTVHLEPRNSRLKERNNPSGTEEQPVWNKQPVWNSQQKFVVFYVTSKNNIFRRKCNFILLTKFYIIKFSVFLLSLKIQLSFLHRGNFIVLVYFYYISLYRVYCLAVALSFHSDRIKNIFPSSETKDRKSTRLNSSHSAKSRMPSSA